MVDEKISDKVEKGISNKNDKNKQGRVSEQNTVDDEDAGLPSKAVSFVDSGVVGFGADVLDDFLDGGVEQSIVTTIYGPSGSGKSNLALLFLVSNILKVNASSGTHLSTSNFSQNLDGSVKPNSYSNVEPESSESNVKSKIDVETESNHNNSEGNLDNISSVREVVSSQDDVKDDNKEDDKKVIFIDTEAGFSINRLKQITDKYKYVLQNTLLFRPFSYKEQHNVFIHLEDYVKKYSVRAIIIDSMVMHYRLELSSGNDNNNITSVNNEMKMELSILVRIAAKYNIPVLITNQVYSDFDSKDEFKMVGGDLLRYSSKCILRLDNLSELGPNVRKISIVKHRSIPEMKSTLFEIYDKGVRKFTKNQF